MTASTYAAVTKHVEALILEYAENDRTQVARLILRAAVLAIPEPERFAVVGRLVREFGADFRNRE